MWTSLQACRAMFVERLGIVWWCHQVFDRVRSTTTVYQEMQFVEDSYPQSWALYRFSVQGLMALVEGISQPPKVVQNHGFDSVKFTKGIVEILSRRYIVGHIWICSLVAVWESAVNLWHEGDFGIRALRICVFSALTRLWDVVKTATTRKTCFCMFNLQYITKYSAMFL